ncbi:ATP-binding cassette domain-containing protein [Actinopolymorpha rutila]|uniref:Lipooligosaccharide transport system ATP-binding protein n=1 Tax=Actinopolymorpha rutila TaxID=446787 RepID=A0A852ZIU8_9ACTN|nr:lipooligosaccharide transport system ATP-binding protein [Actinopolymorpha rutila]
MPEGSDLVVARNLTKRFGSRVAVDRLTFSVSPGEFLGILGPNGAGKTSTMRMVGCASPISAGILRVLGRDPDTDGPAIRAKLGIVPQADILDGNLSVAENVYIYARYFDIPRRDARRKTAELLEFVALAERAKDLVDDLSGGMKRRVVIARALVSDPQLMLLDEPTTGLDPQARHLVWGRLRELRRLGVTQILTTHFMDEAQQLCDRIMVMDQGRVIAEGSPRSLIDRYCSRDVVEVHAAGCYLAENEVRLEQLGDRSERLPDRLLLYTDDGDALARLVPSLAPNAEAVLVRRGTLEDVFLHLTGRGLGE